MNKIKKLLAIEWGIFVPLAFVGVLMQNIYIGLIALIGVWTCMGWIRYFKHKGGSQ